MTPAVVPSNGVPIHYVLILQMVPPVFFRGPKAGNDRPKHILLMQEFACRGFVKEREDEETDDRINLLHAQIYHTRCEVQLQLCKGCS